MADHPASTGFLVKVFPESDTATIIPEPRYKYGKKYDHNMYIIYRSCFFTCEASNRKVDWLRQLNWAYHGSLEGGLMCSFTDKEISEFI